jgi:nucleoside-diphosphate-sugar epimerase
LSFIIDGLIDKEIASGIYNVADDEPLSTNELIRIIAQSLNKKAQIWNCNPTFISMLAKVGAVCHLPLNTDRLQKLTENYVVSNQKIKMALQVDKLPVRAADGLTRTILSFKNT